MAKICKNNIFRLFIGGLLRIGKEGELKAKMQQLHGWSDELYGEYLNIFIEKWNSIPDDAVADEDCAWIARDIDGTLHLFSSEPFRHIDHWVSNAMGIDVYLPKDLYPEVKWEDGPRELLVK